MVAQRNARRECAANVLSNTLKIAIFMLELGSFRLVQRLKLHCQEDSNRLRSEMETLFSQAGYFSRHENTLQLP